MPLTLPPLPGQQQNNNLPAQNNNTSTQNNSTTQNNNTNQNNQPPVSNPQMPSFPWGTPSAFNTSVPTQKTPYQNNLSQPTPPKEPTSRDVWGLLYNLAQTDPAQADAYTQEFLQGMSDPSNPFYNPYMSHTNRSVDNLAAMGIDTSNINDDWFQQTAWLADYLVFNGTTNTPTSPGKKASPEQKAAYEWYQIGKEHETTKKAKGEWAALQEELAYWATNDKMNLSDDQIIERIYGKDGENFKKKYPTLASMDDSIKDPYGTPIELNSVIGYSKDNVYGVLWAARNGGGTGNTMVDMIMSASGQGNQWTENPEISAKLNVNDSNTYSPYSVGMTLEEEGLYFGVREFTRETIDQLLANPHWDDETWAENMRSVQSAFAFTTQTNYELGIFRKKLDEMLDGIKDPKQAEQIVENLLNKEVYDSASKKTVKFDSLKKLDSSIEGRELIPTTGAIDYRKQDMIDYALGVINGNSGKKNGLEKENETYQYTTRATSGASDSGTPAHVPATEAEIADAKAKDEKVAEIAETIDDVATDEEKSFWKNAGSVLFDRMRQHFNKAKSSLDTMKAVTAKSGETAKNNYFTTMMDNMKDIGYYNAREERLTENRARYDVLEKKYGDIQYLQQEVEPRKQFQIGDVTFIMDFNEGDPDKNAAPGYVITDFYAPGRGGGLNMDDIIDYGNDDDKIAEAEKIRAEATAEATKILAAHSKAESYGEGWEKELEEYKALSGQIQLDEQWIAENQADYDARNAKLQEQNSNVNRMRTVMSWLGLDTKGLDDAEAYLGYISQFYYEPQLNNSNETKLEAVRRIADLSGKPYTRGYESEQLHNGIEEVDKQLAYIQMTENYLKENGLQLPADVKRNMDLTKQDLENERRAFEYSAVMTDNDPDEINEAVAAGKAFEAKYGKGNMDYWVNLFPNADEFRTIGNQDRYVDSEGNFKSNIVSEDDQKTYYYLLGKKVMEMGDSLDEAIDQIGKNPEVTEAALREVYSDAGAYQKFMEDESTGYGIWSIREADASAAYGEELVNSGFLGGLEANVMSTLVSPAESIASALELLDTAITGKRFNDKSFAGRAGSFKESTRAATRESILNTYGKDGKETFLSKLANFGYEIYCNRGDSLMNSMVFGSLFNIGGPAGDMLNEFLGASPMGASAALSAAAQAVENGATTDQAWLIAGATFFAETLTEAVTLSNIKGAFNIEEGLSMESLGDIVKDWLTKSGLEEATGETANDLFENFFNSKAEEWYKNPNFQSDHTKMVEKFLGEGMKPDEAEAAAYEEEIKGMLHTALVSYISAGSNVVISTGKAVANSVDYYKSTAKKLQKNGYNVSTMGLMLADMKNRNATQIASPQASTTNRPAKGAPVTNGTQTFDAPIASKASGQEAGAAAPAESAGIKTTRTTYVGGEPAVQTADADVDDSMFQRSAGTEESQEAAAGQEQQTAPEQEQQTAPEAEQEQQTAPEAQETTATPEQQEAASDAAAIEHAKDSDTSTQTSSMASVLDSGLGADPGVSDRANAAAARIRNVFGDNYASTVQDILIGAAEGNVNQQLVKVAIQNAVLGNGEATALIQSEAFQNATAQEKAQMLMETVGNDNNNQAVQDNIFASVQAYRSTRVMTGLAANGHFDQARADQEAARKAGRNAQQAQDDLKIRQDETQAASDARQAADELAIREPSPDHTKDAQQAGQKLISATAVEQEYAQSAENAENAKTEAEEKAKRSTEEAMSSARQIANETNAQEDQQRAEEAAQRAEQERIAAEQAAQAQAEEDQRSGKADEDRTMSFAEDWANNMRLEGTEREAFIQRVMERREQKALGKIDMTGKVSNAEGYLAVQAFARKTGLQFQLSETLPKGTRGMYENGTVYLNADLVRSGEMTVGQALVEASLHEVTHSMQDTKNYKTYRNVVLESMFGEKGTADQLYAENAKFMAAVDQKISDYKKIGQELSIQKAEEEIVADFARLNLAEKEVVQRFMDAGLGGKMRNTLHNINQAMKNFFGQLRGEDRTTAEYLRRAERAYQKALDDVAKAAVHPEGGQFSVAQIAQATGMTFDADTLKLYDQNGNEVDGVNNKITPDMIGNTPAGLLIRNGLSEETQGKAMDMMAGLMNMVARYKDSDLVWEIGATTLSSTFSALKSNSDPQYKTTVDFGTVCAKTQAIIDVMSQVMLDRVKEGKTGGLDRQEIMKVYNEVNKAGLSVPCPVCYVFSRWMGVPSLLGQMSQYQNDYVVTKKGEDGKTLLDKNGNAVIDVEATQKLVDDYIKTAEDQYGDAKAINNAKTKLQTKNATLEEKRIELEGKLYDKRLTAEQKNDIQNQIDDVLSEMTENDKKLGEVRAYNWITQALCKKSGDKYVVDYTNGSENGFLLTPDEVLFDLNRTGDFAKYAKNWRYRNTRGAGMGKAIMPYSGESIGDILYGVKKNGRQSAIKNPWLNMDEKAAARQLREARNRAIKQNLVGGQRLQSTSDFRPEWGLDYIMSFLELQAAGSKVQMYTKVAEAVDFFASVGADVNLSIMGQGQGWHTDENGNQVLDFSSITGMDYKTAKALKDKYDNVQMILVGMNDTHIRLALANSDIDFVIPWHSSGNSKDVLAGLIKSVGEKLDSSVDYTTTQTDMVKGTVKKYKDESGNTVEYTVPGKQTESEKALWDARLKLLTKGGNALTQAERETLLSNPITKDLYERFTVEGKDPDCFGVKLSKDQASQIFPYEYWDTSLTKDQADENGKRFVEYCEAMGIVPRFSQFKDDPGYWKLLIDRPMYNNDGTYHQQSVINVTNAQIGELNETGELTGSDLPQQAQAKYAPKDPRNANYEKYTKAEQDAIENAEAAIDGTAKYDDGSEGQYSVYGDMTDADIDQMLAQANQDYSDAVARGDMKAAQQDVDFAAEQAGYTDKAYHGTNSIGFTEFDMGKSQGEIFVAYNSNVAGTYADAGDSIRRINEAEDIADRLYSMDSEEIVDWLNNLDEQTKARLEKVGIRFDVASADDDGWINLDSEEESMGFARQDLVQKIEELNTGVYELYTKPGRQLVIECDGHSWKNIPWALVVDADPDAEGEHPEMTGVNTRQISKWAKEHGYDSVRINAIYDHGGSSFDFGEAYGDIGIFFNPRDVKSADPVTYDNNGNPIPLDQRFTDSPDLRYSAGGEITDADIDQQLANAGLLPSEEVNANVPGQPTTLPGMPSGESGSAQRQFGSKTAQESDALHQEVKDYLFTHSDYTPDSNQAQIDRSVDWVRSMARTDDEDGYRAAVEAVLKPDFDYRSADGQARMLTVMSMAALKGDTDTELRLADAYNQQGTDLGRQLQARKIFRLMTPIGRRQALQQEVARINQDYRNHGKDTTVELSDFTLKAAEAAQTEEDFEKVQKAAAAELAQQMPANWKEKIQTWRMLSMLANPRTHIRNILGNAIFMPTVGLKNAIGAGLENVFIKDGERTKAVRYSNDAKAFAKQDALAMKNTLTGEAKYSAEGQIDREKKAFGQGNGILSRTIGKGVQAVSDFNSWALEAEDWIFLNKHYQNAMASYMTANGLTSEQMTGSTLEKARAYALQEAQKATYRDANKISSKLNQWSRDGGGWGFLVDTVLPFKKTPANILRRGIEYSPVGLLQSFATAKRSLDLYAAWEANGRKGEMPKGAKSPTEVIDRIASGLTGTGIAALGALGFALGAIKLGFGGDDDDELEKERGSQEYSVELFGHSFTIDWAAPVCMPFFTGAALYKEFSENIGNVEDAEDAAGMIGRFINGLGSISEPVFNLSMLDGVSSLLKSASSTQKNKLQIFELLQNIAANYVGSLVPSFSGAVARTIDTTRRQSYVESGDPLRIWKQKIEQAENKIPWLSMRNIPYRNVWGEADVSAPGEAFLENFILPGYLNKMTDERLTQELQRAYDQTGEASVIPKIAGKTVGNKKLTDQEYDKYVVTRGQLAKELLNDLIGRDEFITLTPTDQSEGNPEAQVNLIGEVWKYANAIARHEIDPEYKMDKWISGAYAAGNPIDAIFEREEAKAQQAYGTQMKGDLFTAITEQDAETIGTCLEGLRQSGKTDKDIRSDVMNGLRNQYKEAYLAGDRETMDAIKYGMLYMDLGEYSFTDEENDPKSIFIKWQNDADKERDN